MVDEDISIAPSCEQAMNQQHLLTHQNYCGMCTSALRGGTSVGTCIGHAGEAKQFVTSK